MSLWLTSTSIKQNYLNLFQLFPDRTLAGWDRMGRSMGQMGQGPRAGQKRRSKHPAGDGGRRCSSMSRTRRFDPEQYDAPNVMAAEITLGEPDKHRPVMIEWAYLLLDASS